MFASSTIFSQSSLETISVQFNGVPNNIAILFYLTFPNVNLSLNLFNYFFSITKKTVSV